MFLLRSSYVPLLEAVACQCRLPFPSYLREVAEDGSVVGGVEIELPVSGAPNEFRTHFFWSSGHAELCLLYEQAAFEAITFLQGLYGFVIADYNYEVMVGYRTLARSAALLAAAVARLAHASGSAVVVGSGDGFHPNVDPSIQARNRRIRRKTIDLRRHKFRGAIPLYYLSASLLGSLYHVDVCCVLFFAMYIEHVVTGPLPTDWTGFPAEFAESLKANYAGRSYHGSPEYRCPHCKAVFWFQESIQSASSWKENRIVYNLCFLHTVEFQKRGLPHAHILIWLKGDKREVSAETIDTIDDFICAEIPDPILDPLGYVLVSEFMMHGPCGELNDKCVCMKENTCSKHFPKEFREETIIDEHGFALYRRRRDGRTVYKNGHYLDNRWVVPYNMAMLKKYQAHLNVEWCNKTQVMKYLFKYVTKGPDFSNVYLQRAKANCSAADGSDPPPVDEVNEYLLARYICEQDAFWRIYGYTLHGKTPAVERLVVHLQNKNWISFSASTNLFRLAASDFLKKTTLTEWFVANRNYEEGRCLTYCDYPTKFTWDGESRSWHPRGGGKKIGRVYYVGPNAGELYYLRMLLMIVKGARSFVDVRTFQGTVYGSFKEACVARGLLGDDLEWYRAFDEAVVWGFGHRLRHLFVTMLIHCSVKNEKDFFSKYWVHLADDIQYRIRIALRKMDYMVPEAELKDLLLDELSSLFVKYGSSIANFNLPGKTSLHPINYDNRLIREEMSYDAKKLSAVAATLLLKLNADQRVAYKTIVDTVLAEKPGFYFVSGFGGAGKTFLWNAIIAYLRGQGKIVLTVASSGVAALLLAGGRTAHSRFKIPLQVDSNSFCDIKRGTNLADLLKETCLIIWDEALMTSRKCFEALDRTLRDVLSGDDPLLADVPFGGKVVVLGGDLRQILPVIEGGSRPQIIDAAITQSPLWKSVVPLVLSINMRLSVPDAASSLKESIQVFSKWVLDLGDGKLPTTRREGESESTWIQIPEDLLIRTDDNKIAAIVSSTYVDFLANYHRMEYLRERAILAPTNDFALEVNDFVLGLVPQPPREYLSCDSIANGSDAVNEVDLFYPPEVLNAIALINFPQHKLVLKPGVPIMLLRNLSQANGLCNGTRLVVKELGDRVIQAVIMTGSHIGDVVYIPRIELISNKTKWPFLLKRRQFPVRVCYAMTINKSQGQTLSFVGIYLKQPVFCHGQLYVAVSRVTSRSALKLLILNADGSCGSETRNIVFPEIYASAGSL
ncbi:hypothetical protein ACQ4PT_059380 [Festuca glaucescens]